MLTPIILVLGLMAATAVIAYWSDNLGKKLGKKRVSLFGLRPKQTATLITITSSMPIMLFTLGALLAVHRPLRVALLRYDIERRSFDIAREESQRARADEKKARLGEARARENVQRESRKAQGARREAIEKSRIAREAGFKTKQARQSAREAERREREARRREREASGRAESARRGEQQAKRGEQSARNREKSAVLAADKAQQTLASAQSRLRTAQSRLASASRRLVSAQAQLVFRQAEVVRVTSQRDRTQADLTRVTRQRGSQRKVVLALGREILAQTAQIENQTAQIENQKAKVAAFSTQIEGLQAEVQVANAELASVRTALVDVRTTPTLVPAGETLAETVIAPRQSQSELDTALDSLLAQARVQARRLGEPLRKVNMSIAFPERTEALADGSTLKVDEATQRSFLTRLLLSADAPSSVRVVAARLHTISESRIEVRLRAVYMRTAFKIGDVLAQSDIDGRLSDARIFRQLGDLVDDGRHAAEDKGVQPPVSRSVDFYAPLTNERIFEALRSIQALKGPARVRIVAAADLSTASPLSVRFEVAPAVLAR